MLTTRASASERALRSDRLPEVLEHLDEPQPLVAAMSKARPEGRLFVTIPNGYGPEVAAAASASFASAGA